MKKSDNRKRRNTGLDNQGTTMVEILVSFVVLMIVLGIMYGMIAFAAALRMRAQDARTASQTFTRELYNKENVPADVPDTLPENDKISARSAEYQNVTVRNYETRGNTPLFYLSLNTTDTSVSNFGQKGAGYYNTYSASSRTAQESYWLSMFNIEAITYVYKPESGMDAEHIIIPKAVKFIHKEDRDGEN